MREHWPSANGLVFVIAIFQLLAFALLAVKAQPVDYGALMLGALSVAILLFQYLVFVRVFPGLDRWILIIANMLVSLGFILQYRLNPDMCIRQMQWFGVAVVCMVVALIAVRYWTWLDKLSYVYMGITLAFLVLTLLFGSREGGAKSWFSFGTVSFQPSELGKILLVFALASAMKERRSLWRLIPLGIFAAVSVGLLVLQKDLGAALLYFSTSIVVFYIATSNLLLTGAALGAAGVGSVAAYKLFSHVRVRIAAWQNPWADVEGGGYQIVQSLIAIASGGLLGLGLGLGSPKSIPAYHTDFIFAVICEEFGVLVGIAVILFYVVLILRGARIALDAGQTFYKLVAIGCTAMVALQTFIIVGGVIKMIPLTGVTLPFVSYGGSSLVTNMVLIGILEAVAVRNHAMRESAMGPVEIPGYNIDEDAYYDEDAYDQEYADYEDEYYDQDDDEAQQAYDQEDEYPQDGQEDAVERRQSGESGTRGKKGGGRK
ncbi:FtsW/RodA/SpoVE family cell cycle protein [Christensenellaceae bacterium NSJ-44]|uniref:FtsW/RodA/SpoVE family cell cycle protein n=1 Tax=Luoshenia tenuis TaxID=2763654 RepID=A0A926HMM5_9FIRM|nr:FtsW/RodA/SpoVE family cell cycle protein [Luoshenia tenuis]MBC8528276.1 FtsW/RodA/SpoVE family cell cycle protein [Luoshenia tenuis]